MSKKLKVLCSSEHPHCEHGPTVYFYYDEDLESGYFACAAFRNKNNCSYHLSYKDFIATGKDSSNSSMKTKDSRKQRKDVTSYCSDCDKFLSQKEVCNHEHKSVHNLKTMATQDPTQFLRPLSADDSQAQYFFDDKALAFFLKCFQDINTSKVICMGAPRLHKYLLNNSKTTMKSYLLDFDHRFHYFFDDSEYAWHNMCNNHFFDKQQEAAFHRFLRRSSDLEQLLIFTDPPFGCRTEVIAQTLKALTNLYNRVNGIQHRSMPIFWIFPYFGENYIKEVMPEMQMSDYKVNYTNHQVYADQGDKTNRKLGSPVRVFTNVPLQCLRLPMAEGYKYCKHCKYFTSLENQHCTTCGCCPSKNGSTYRHCPLCDICVKPNYVHCGSCRRCMQKNAAHSCVKYQEHQQCWICLKTGHIEHNCEAWLDYCRREKFKRISAKKCQNKRVCFVCNKAGHNEKRCRERKKHLIEIDFMGHREVCFK